MSSEEIKEGKVRAMVRMIWISGPIVVHFYRERERERKKEREEGREKKGGRWREWRKSGKDMGNFKKEHFPIQQR